MVVGSPPPPNPTLLEFWPPAPNPNPRLRVKDAFLSPPFTPDPPSFTAEVPAPPDAAPDKSPAVSEVERAPSTPLLPGATPWLRPTPPCASVRALFLSFCEFCCCEDEEATVGVTLRLKESYILLPSIVASVGAFVTASIGVPPLLNGALRSPPRVATSTGGVCADTELF